MRNGGLPGSTDTETVTSMDFSDYNTVIYGHKMKMNHVDSEP